MKMTVNERKTEKQYKPFLFFGLVFLITWSAWFLAAYLSYYHSNPDYYTAALVPGLLAPILVTVGFICWPGNQIVRKDFWQRLFDIKKIKVKPLFLICILMSTTVVIAILISLAFGESMKQFAFSEDFRFSAGSASVLAVLIIAPLVEEIGWRGYGVDALLERFGLLKGSLMFGGLWSLWHFPLLFVKDYSVNMLAQENVWYAVNFFISIIPLGIILNWLYIKSNRSIACLFIFHLFLNLMQTATKMSEFTSCIQTIVIIIYAFLLVVLNRELFLPKLTFDAF